MRTAIPTSTPRRPNRSDSSSESSSSPTSISSLDVRRGDTLTIQGPSIYRGITPPDDYPLPAPDSPHLPRSIHRNLIGPNGLAQSDNAWTLEFRDGYEAWPKGRFQTAKGYVYRKGSTEKFWVGIQLFHYGLPSLQVDYETQLAHNMGTLNRFAPEVDGAYFHTYRELQGREIAICYGTFSATIGGSLVWITIVEDLEGVLTNPENWAKNTAEPGDGGPAFTFDGGDREFHLSRRQMVAKHTGEIRFLRQFLECDNTFLPRITFKAVHTSSTADNLLFVAHGFHNPQSLKTVKRALGVDYFYHSKVTNLDGKRVLRPWDLGKHFPGLMNQVACNVPIDQAYPSYEALYKLKLQHGLKWDYPELPI